MADNKVNIFDILHKINVKDKGYYSSASEEIQKQIQPFVLMRWMTGTANPSQIILLNEFVNPYVFSLYKHKDLQWRLLTTVAPGKFKKYNWVKGVSQQSSKKPLSIVVLKQTFNYSTLEAERQINLTSGEYLLNEARNLGWQDSELAKLGKEWDIVIKLPKGSKKLEKTDSSSSDNTPEHEYINTTDNLLSF